MLVGNWIHPTAGEVKSLAMEHREASFQSSSPPDRSGRSCLHHPSLRLFTQDDRIPAGCGLCWLIMVWESEVPGRIHAYKLLADNGKPQVAPAFWSHVEAATGLVRPKQGQNLRDFRLARGQLYRAPKPQQFPLLRALWNGMGYQPKLVSAVILTLQGREPLQIAVELKMTPGGAQAAIVKGTRLVLREIRSLK